MRKRTTNNRNVSSNRNFAIEEILGLSKKHLETNPHIYTLFYSNSHLILPLSDNSVRIVCLKNQNRMRKCKNFVKPTKKMCQICQRLVSDNLLTIHPITVVLYSIKRGHYILDVWYENQPNFIKNKVPFSSHHLSSNKKQIATKQQLNFHNENSTSDVIKVDEVINDTNCENKVPAEGFLHVIEASEGEESQASNTILDTLPKEERVITPTLDVFKMNLNDNDVDKGPVNSSVIDLRDEPLMIQGSIHHIPLHNTKPAKELRQVIIFR